MDANLLAGGGYHIGLADYGTATWEWRGPFTANQVLLSTAAGEYTSPLGNVFICIVVSDGAVADVVGLEVSLVNPVDSVPPPVPQAPSVTAVNQGLLLEWPGVAASDLAGYHVYYSNAHTLVTESNGVAGIGYLLPARRYLLTGLLTETTVGISAVDVSGNESDWSAAVTATPLAGVAPMLGVSVTAPSALLGEPVELIVNGAEVYDIDVDGDGVFELLGNTSGRAAVDTARLGMVRAYVEGSAEDGNALSSGGASVLVFNNSSPVAVASATLTSGIAPLTVAFSGEGSEDIDGDLIGGGWDFDGDGIFDVWSDTGLEYVESAEHSYATPGVYNARLRVVDEAGAWDVDTLAILVNPPGNQPPIAELEITPEYGVADDPFSLDASGSTDPDGSITTYEWDFDGDGLFDATGYTAAIEHNYPEQGVFSTLVRVTDNDGAVATATAEVRVIKLLDSGRPWAMHGYDAQNTRHSRIIGAQTNDLQWQFQTTGPGQYFDEPAIGPDGTLYVATRYDLRAIDPDGSLKWAYPMKYPFRAASIGPEGTIYIKTYHNNNPQDFIYAINPDGTLKWEIDLGLDGASEPGVAPDGTMIYYSYADDKIYALNPDGSQKWSQESTRSYSDRPVFAADGSMYWRSSSLLIALNPDATDKWSFDTQFGTYANFFVPAVGPDGSVYVEANDGYIHAFNPDGSEKWTFLYGGWGGSSVAPDGTVLIVERDSGDFFLNALDPDGNLLWSNEIGVSFGSVIRPDGSIVVYGTGLEAFAPAGTPMWTWDPDGEERYTPVVGADGSVFLVVAYWLTGTFLEAVDSNGNKLWEYGAGGSFITSPVIDSDNYVYVSSSDGNQYVLGSDGNPYLLFEHERHYFLSSPLAIIDDGLTFLRVSRDLTAHNRQGTQLWSFPFAPAGDIGMNLFAPPVIDALETIYFGDEYGLHALDLEGNLKWSAQDEEYSWNCDGVAVDPVGIVIATTSYNCIAAYDTSGNELWNSQELYPGDLNPVVGLDGAVYITDNGYSLSKLYQINSFDGVTNWEFEVEGYVYAQPALNNQLGTLYFGTSNGTLYAVGTDGIAKWTVDTGARVYASPAIGGDGMIYIPSGTRLQAYSYDGTLQWEFDTGDWIKAPPAIGPNGTVYIGNERGTLFAIGPGPGG